MKNAEDFPLGGVLGVLLVYVAAVLFYRKTPVSIFTSDFSWKKPHRRTSACHYTSEGMYEKEETHL